MTVGSALAGGKSTLERAGVDTASLDSALILGLVLGIDRARLLARLSDPLPPLDLDRYLALIERRASGEPYAWIAGKREFWGLDFEVSPDVLIPRPDTEILVEEAIRFLESRQALSPGTELRALDLCTGSGCIAVSIKSSVPSAIVVASDLSIEALAVARSNAIRLLAGRPKGGSTTPDSPPDPILFIRSDLFASIPGRFDLIATNPPYVPTGVIPGLSREVQREPHLALDGGGDGLDLIRKIIPEAFERLDAGGLLLVESGEEQVDGICQLLKVAGFSEVGFHRDLSGRKRVSAGRRGECDGRTDRGPCGPS